jgi:hypothetical protein
MLPENDIMEKIKNYCKLQDGCDLRDALQLEQRVLGLCEALGAEQHLIEQGLSQELLESIGIQVKQVNPVWVFEEVLDGR